MWLLLFFTNPAPQGWNEVLMGVTTVKEDKDRLLNWFMYVWSVWLQVCVCRGWMCNQCFITGVDGHTGAYCSEVKPDLCWKKIYVHVPEISLWPKNSLKILFLLRWLDTKRSLQGEKSSVCVVKSILAGNWCCVSVISIANTGKRYSQGPKISTHSCITAILE